MVTVAATKGISPRFSVEPGSRRSEHLFFSGMAFLILILVFVGFAKTYFLAGAFRAPLPNLLIHVHGAAFSCWILLLVTQTSLVSAGRVDIHRRLGVLGFLLASLMVTLGILAGTNMLARGGPPGEDAQSFYAVTMLDMLLFATVVFLAFRARKRPDSHKRLVLIATIGLMDAALDRWPVAFLLHRTAVAFMVSYTLLAVIMIYDLWSIRRIHRATLYGSAIVILLHQMSFPLGRTAVWHTFANWAQHIVPMRF